MSKSLDKEWLAGCIPDALEQCEVWDEALALEARDPLAMILDAKSIMLHAAAEIRAQRILIKNQSKRIDELERELDNDYFDEPERDW